MGPIVFLPWLVFLGQHGSVLIDQASLRIGLGPDCGHVRRTYIAEVARSLPAKTRGLSGRRKALKSEEAMLFVYESPRKVSYWMRETFIPLEIGYFDGKGRLTDKYPMSVEPNPSDPKNHYPSRGDVSAALEVAPGGFRDLPPGKTSLCVERPAR